MFRGFQHRKMVLWIAGRSISAAGPGSHLGPTSRVPIRPLWSPWHLNSTGHRQHRSGAGSGDAEQVELHFKLRDGSRKTVSVPSGTSVLEAAHLNEIELEGACEASLACSTCHVILPQEVYNVIPEATEREEDLLDQAPCLTPTSRLACQVIVDEHLRNAEVELPQMTLNFYVDGHVPTPH
mmetsp:Transcript_76404/g.211031  ORF Transcript_76404/g.211031 Transcript_76404/m.211031 type:complete len:181 (-) Transcript_76404:126-668(-)|eukprot:CAMPEP_0179119462 /NCGR_PEP_ID=MMETSP0796-20121207/56235_1 /TAXON_ID=73915 /ORGANISM="Pyrodinium bahamense, Strain pbaha01" /LENGTH=180 /DNA_ID=CAMNT_0020817959 /DNA_START=56 /DNA_END=598 /DNA_ORIENTATION=-